jgi:hypothetical protein
MKRTGIWLSLLAVAPMVLQAQNLLINGSFEEPSMAGAGRHNGHWDERWNH